MLGWSYLIEDRQMVRSVSKRNSVSRLLIFSYLWVVEVKFLFDIFLLQLLLAVEKYGQSIG